MKNSIVEAVEGRLFRARLESDHECEAADRICAAAQPELNIGSPERERYPDLRKCAEFAITRAVDRGWPNDIANASIIDLALGLPDIAAAGEADNETFLIAELCAMLGVQNDTLGKAIDEAGLPRADAGAREHRYTKLDARKIAEARIKLGNTTGKKKAQQALNGPLA